MFRPYAALVDGTIEYHGNQAAYTPDPIAIGAVGGSGTRVLAQVLTEAGVAMATPSNEAHDALEWPPMKMIINRPRLQKIPLDQRMHAAFWGLEQLLYARRQELGLSGRVGWKVPATHLWLRELGNYFPGFQYIHILRNGLDMAYSRNQRQLRMWGKSLGIHTHFDGDGMAPPQDALEYWLLANENAMRCADALQGQFLLVRFEELCRAPFEQLERVFSFLRLDLPVERRRQLAAFIKTPHTSNRYAQYDWQNDFSPTQLERLRAFDYIPGTST
ncbi:sulfotransferase [Halioglobus sp. HI00S01]|uniref:sulfotransferase family protein n=1 Tax=Halioglobus sp. HI00S01 TaxID=1822214 RepID=UPI000AE4D646|nr:sulfotransferase [Halioglobus sp. HI00S01]